MVLKINSSDFTLFEAGVSNMLYFHPKNAAKDQKDGDLLAANQLLPQQAFRKSALGALAQQTQSFGKSRIEQEGKIEIYIYIYIHILIF